MLKSLIALPILLSPLCLSNQTSEHNVGFVLQENVRGNYTLVGVNNSLVNSKEIKIYYEEDKLIDEVDDEAFTLCTQLSTLILSYSVKYISNEAFIDSIRTVKYTGSEIEYNALNIAKQFDNLYFYGSDEGFVNYWNTFVRPEENSNICDITADQYKAVYSLYTNLTISEREIVDNTLDKADAKIGASMKVLIETFDKNTQPSNRSTTWNQKSAISFIIVVAIIGMTSICVFYLLKTKQIIE